MKYHTFLFAIILSFSLSRSFSQQKINHVKQIDLTDGLNCNETQMNLSEMAEKVEYIFLETNDSCLIGTIAKVVVDDSLVFISDKNRLLIFNNSGKFLTAVGHKGRGPGEYVEVEDFAVDFASDRIFVLDRFQQKVFCYTYNGKYQSEFRYKAPYPSKIIVVKNSGLMISYATPQYKHNKNYGFALYTFSGNFIRNIFNRENEGAVDGMSEAGLHRLSYYCDSLTFWEIHLDTIYRINNEGVFTPRYALNYKGYHQVKNRSSLEKNNYYFSYFIDTKKYLFFLRGAQNNEIKHLVYNKETGRATKIAFNTKDLNLKNNTGFMNDIDGGYPFLPIDAQNDGRLYCTFFSYQFQELAENNPYKDLKILNIEKKAYFYNRISKSKAVDNPVIMLVTLKK